MSKLNPQLKAALSYWTSKRDESYANLDVALNKSVGIGMGNPQLEVNELLRQFSEAQAVVDTINLIIQNLNPAPPKPDVNNEPTTEPA